MRSRVQKWGNSLALRIPKAIADDLGLTVDSPVNLCAIKGRLEVRPEKDSVSELDALLARVTSDNLHVEHDSGHSVGAEEW